MKFYCLANVFLFAVLFLVLPLQSSIYAGDSNEWRPISPAELAMKESTVEKDADAEAIFWEVRVDDSSSEELAMNHYVRVKIFNERGREKFSKIDVPFLKGTKIKNVMARVIKPDGSIVDLKKEDVFDRDIIKASGIKVRAKSFAVPGIEPGVIVEYRYREVVDDAGAMGMRLTFQRDVPIQTLSYYYKPYNGKKPNYQSYNMSDAKFVEDKKGYYLATRVNVPSFQEEPQMPPEDQVRPWMLLQGVRINITDVSMNGFSFTIKDPSNPASYWGSVAAERAGIAKLINKSNDDVKAAANSAAGTAATPEDKLKKIYEFCQSNIKNTSFDASLTDEERQKLNRNKTIADVLKRKSGDGRDVDLLFGAMAAALGFETRVAFSADRSQIFFDPEMTNDYFLHPAAIAVKVGENWKFYNPGTSYLPAGSLVWYEEGVWALLVGEKQNLWVQTPLTGIDRTAIKRTGKFKLLEDGTLEGTARFEYNGHLGTIRKFENDDYSIAKQEENFKDEIKANFGSAEITDVKIENVTDPNKPFVCAFKLRIPNYTQKTGKRLFLQPNVFKYNAKPLFTASTRKNSIYFNYPWAENDNIEIELPNGYALENANAPAIITDPQKIGSDTVRIFINKDQNILTYKRQFYFGNKGNIIFPVEAYQPLKTMFEAFHQSDTHSLVLKQSASTATTADSAKNN